LVVCFSATAESFATPANLWNVLHQIAPTVIAAVAMTFVIITGGIDLSVGSTVAVTGAGLALMLEHGVGATLALLATLAIGTFIGALNGYFSAYQKMQPFIVTVATLSLLSGVALWMTNGYSIPISSAAWVTRLGQGQIGPIPIAALIAVGIAVLGWVVLGCTPFGRYVVSLGSNAESLHRSGVNIRRVGFFVYVLSGLAAGVSGVLIATRLGSGSSNAGGAVFALDVITAVVLGGTDLFGGHGTVLGTVLGSLALGVIENGLVLNQVSPFYVQIVQGAILLVAILANTRLFSRFTT
jgi:simple sugar transport system permease protein